MKAILAILQLGKTACLPQAGPLWKEVKKVEWKFLDPYRQQLHTALDITSLVALGLATYGAFFGDMWLASTQWLLVSIWMLILSSHVRRV